MEIQPVVVFSEFWETQPPFGDMPMVGINPFKSLVFENGKGYLGLNRQKLGEEI